MALRTSLVDGHGRRVATLRVSLTDHCNFRCVYCMPPEGAPHLPKTDYLTADELARFVQIAARTGVSRYRLTGGEPLLRPDIVAIVSRMSRLGGVDELSMTTNGSLLAPLAEPLRKAGLGRLNVSLDSLDPERFAEVARHDSYTKVRDGVEAALAAGFPVKLNVVVLRGIDDDEILGFVELAVGRGIEVRFLEFMPLCGSGWRPDLVYPIGRVRDLVGRHYRLTEQPRADRPAQTFTVQDSAGVVGFIAPLTEPFCENCSRIRITVDGKIRPCLFSAYEVDVRDVLRCGASDDDVEATLRHTVANKPRGSQFDEVPFAGGADVPVYAGPLIRNIGG